MKINNVTNVGIFIALAVVLSIIESFIPLSIPGFKIGLSNVVTLVALYKLGVKDGIIIHTLRIVLVGLIFSGVTSISFILSISGGILALVIMVVLKKYTKLSLMSISVISSVFHSIGQIFAAYIFISNIGVFYYLIIILVLSIFSGILTSILSYLTLKAFRIEIKLFNKIELLIPILVSCVLSITHLILDSIEKKSDEGSIAKVYYQNTLILEINLSNPESYSSYSDSFIDCYTEDESYLYEFNIYNKDEEDYFKLVLEVKEEGIRIKEETCAKHICSNKGFIYNKYESIVCLPNTFVVMIENPKLSEIDYLL